MYETTITPSMDESGQRLTISISGPFDFNAHRRFRQAFVEVPARDFVVDLTDTKYIDSSGLGMLLQLKEHAASRGGEIALVVASGVVRQMLELAHFDRLMNIVEPAA